jgi:hypothetical protein
VDEAAEAADVLRIRRDSIAPHVFAPGAWPPAARRGDPAQALDEAWLEPTGERGQAS